MLGLACQYDPQQHELINPVLLSWCKRQAEGAHEAGLADRLFCYRHRIWKTFVIAMWVNGPKGLFLDILNLGHSLSNFSHQIGQEFVRRLRQPLTADETARQLRNADSSYVHEKVDRDARERYEQERRLRDGW